MNNKTLRLGFSALLLFSLTACAYQSPAPVVDDFLNRFSSYLPQPKEKVADLPTSSATVLPTVSGEDLSKPAEPEAPVVPVEPVAPQKPMAALTHTVQKDETVWRISRRYGLTVEELRKLNGLKDNTISVGQKLRVSLADMHTPQSNAQTTTQTDSSPVEEPSLLYKTHEVEKGENLFRIGLKYDVSALDIMAANDIAKPEDLMAGQLIRIPVLNAAGVGTNKDTAEGTPEIKRINEAAARAKGFIWPAKGPVLESFGDKGAGVNNTGINIGVKANDPIYAAEEGKVIYADSGLKTYGNLILLRHKNGLITAYAYNSRNLVKRDEKVVKGQLIALAGSTGGANRPMLHFEVRRNARAVDPLKILPRNR